MRRRKSPAWARFQVSNCLLKVSPHPAGVTLSVHRGRTGFDSRRLHQHSWAPKWGPIVFWKCTNRASTHRVFQITTEDQSAIGRSSSLCIPGPIGDSIPAASTNTRGPPNGGPSCSGNAQIARRAHREFQITTEDQSAIGRSSSICIPGPIGDSIPAAWRVPDLRINTVLLPSLNVCFHPLRAMCRACRKLWQRGAFGHRHFAATSFLAGYRRPMRLRENRKIGKLFATFPNFAKSLGSAPLEVKG